MKQALIVGSNGQDGRLLGGVLAAKGYGVAGLSRQALKHADGRYSPPMDLTDVSAVEALLRENSFDEVYYLAAFHHSAQQATVFSSRQIWSASMAVNATGPVTFLDAIRCHAPSTRFFYAGSCLTFGDVEQCPQNEDTCQRPACVYGITKAAGTQGVRLYRETHGVFASTGILYNHESHLRPRHFLSRKIVNGAWRISQGLQRELVLADLNARADWGYAPDFVDGFWKTLQAARPDDYVLATGETRTVMDWVEKAFALAGLDWQEHVREDAGLSVRARPAYVGDFSKIRTLCGWTPTTNFDRMIELMFEQERQQS